MSDVATLLRATSCAQTAAAAGFTGDALVTITAIGGAESGWDAAAVGDKDRPHNGCGSYGWLQINSCPGRDGADPIRRGSNPTELLDPLVCARAAHAISSGGRNFTPWTTYTSGRYLAFMSTARRAVDASSPEAVDRLRPLDKAPTGGGGFAVSVGLPGPLQPLGNAITALLSPSTWLRVGAALLGAVLLVAGLLMLAPSPLRKVATSGPLRAATR